MPRSNNKRADRRAALERVKAAKSGVGSTSALDDFDAGQDDEEDVYEYYDEDEYKQLVESRRQREDFVVDDDGLGYYDDGEEHIGDMEEESGSLKKRTQAPASATLTAQALKKARKNKRAAAAASANGSSSDPKGSSTGGNMSMWAFVNRGGPAAAAAASSNDNKNSKKPRSLNGNKMATNKKSVDALLEQLDDDVAPLKKRARTAPGGGRRGLPPHRGRGGVAGGNSSRARSSTGASAASSRRGAAGPSNRKRAPPPQQHYDDDDDDDAFPMNHYDDDEDDGDVHDNQHDDAATATRGEDEDEALVASAEKTKHTPSPASSTKSVRFSDDVETREFASPPAAEVATTKTDDDASEEQEGAEDTPAKPQRRRLLARPKLGKVSKPAQHALEKKASSVDPSSTGANNNKNNKAASSAPKLDVSFQPDVIAAETTGPLGSVGSTAGQLDLQPCLQTNADGDNYLDFFWMDISERNGEILLFGKVQAPDNKFVSACAVVSGNVRNLFVLPKSGAEMVNVHQEMNSILHKEIVPVKAGASWAGKVVKRSYAFEDPTIPRDGATEYMKVVYDAKYPVPPVEVCQNGGQHFDKILGAGASTIENFIVKRKLMGPCWLRIAKPVASKAPISWCKVECAVGCPKSIVRLDLAEKGTDAAAATTTTAAATPRPPPPVVSLSMKFKTVVNPKTHKSEIVSVSAVCHKQIQLDSASDASPRHMTQLSLIRPLDTSGEGGSVAKFPRDFDKAVAASGLPQLKREANERAMLSRLMAQIGQWDPDVLVGHNAWGYDLEVLLQRCVDLKVGSWSRIGRRRRAGPPNKTLSSWSHRKDIAISQAISGRLLVDTYLSAKELLRETTYSLTNLAASQLKTARQDIEPVDIPNWFCDSKTIVNLATHTLFDAQLVQRLMLKLQILPLTKQLTNIAGNLWSHTLKSNRAERTEYLLLHEFHNRKFLPPEKKRFGQKGGADKSNKAKYSGGLVLEPKKGLYDSYILLLDFNSLYPSIIQEYNLCFTTINWSEYANQGAKKDEGEDEQEQQKDGLPPLPDDGVEQGVLPRVIKNLVDRRRSVKKFLKAEKNPDKKEELDIRQKALKLTANSMYGCLGFSNSRFFAQPIAALVTSMGRDTLQRTVDIATNTIGLDVIYGDTDSIMINTRLNDEQDLRKVKELGDRVKKEVNRLYRTLELEIDGIFRSMLLLKKKKYAAKTVEEMPDGKVKYGQELKGLDLVRRDWCVQSKDTGRYVTEQILSGQDSEVVVENILSHLEAIAKKMRAGELPLEKFTITKGLSKHPNEYPDSKSQAHVVVAKQMLANNLAVNTGDHIPYIITEPIEEQQIEGAPAKKVPSATERARHPDEIIRSDGVLKPDVEWYLTQQILPPISRLCEPIEGATQQILAGRLGLDAARYNHSNRSSGGGELNDDDLIDYTPASLLKDEERFKDVEKLRLFCRSCGADNDFPGVFHTMKDEVSGSSSLVSGLRCTNPDCSHPKFFGYSSHFECMSLIANAVSIWVRGLTCRYYEGVTRCDEPSCGLETRQVSVAGSCCLRKGCNGTVVSVDKEQDVHNHLKYLETCFSIKHACDQIDETKFDMGRSDILKLLPKHDRAVYDDLHRRSKQCLEYDAYNWISFPSIWKNLGHVGPQKQ